MAATFGFVNKLSPQCNQFLRLILMKVIMGYAICGNLGVAMVSNAFGHFTRLRVEFRGRAFMTEFILLLRSPQRLADGLYLPLSSGIDVRNEFDRISDEAIPLDLADQSPNAFECPQVLAGFARIAGDGRREILIEDLIHREILHRDKMICYQIAHLSLIAHGLGLLELRLHVLLPVFQSYR